jgi:hypothetical protein
MSKKILIEQCKDCKNNKKRYIFTFKSINNIRSEIIMARGYRKSPKNKNIKRSA